MFNMRPAIQGYRLSVLRTSGQAALGKHSLGLRSRGLGGAWQRSSCRQLHLLSSRGTESSASGAGLLGRATGALAIGAKPRVAAASPVQTRSFRKANYVERIGDNERTEEILEALDVKDDEKDVPPQRQVMGEENPPSEKDTKKWCGDMTKGMLGHIGSH